MQLPDNIKKPIEHLGYLFYPRLCEGCSKPLLVEEDVLCLNCNVYNLPRTAYHHIADNETAMRFAGRVPIVRATSLAYFTAEGLLQHLLHQLKYNDKKEVGLFLGRQFGYDLKQTGWARDIDMIVPVPLHAKKEALRGYNQTELIANGMSAILDIPVDTNLLSRTRHTESQTQKTREQRIENMQDAFIVKNPLLYSNKHVLLIDDVLTTGATLEACARAVLSIPDVRISIATIGVAN